MKKMTATISVFLMLFLMLPNFRHAETVIDTELMPGESKQKEAQAIAQPDNIGNILWDTYHGIYQAYSPSGSFSSLVTILSDKGYAVDENDSGILNLDLKNYNIIVICVSSSWYSIYTSAEVTVLKNFVENGGGLLIMADNSKSPRMNIMPVSQAFGTTVSVKTISEINLYVTNMTNHPIFEGIDEIYMRSAGELSATLPSSEEAWADSGEPVVTGAVLTGHVVVLGDYNIFDNFYISKSSNRLFAENLFDWLAKEPFVWDFCIKDVLYSTSYFLNIEANDILIGQATDPSPDFPAPLTGYCNSERNTCSFSIGYRNDNTRHYWIDVSNLAGYTWEVQGSDSKFGERPREAQLVSCNIPAIREK